MELMKNKSQSFNALLGAVLLFKSSTLYAECEVKEADTLCCTHTLVHCEKLDSGCELSNKKTGKLFHCSPAQGIAQTTEDCNAINSHSKSAKCLPVEVLLPSAKTKRKALPDLGTPEEKALLEKFKNRAIHVFVNKNSVVEAKLAERSIQKVLEGLFSPRIIGIGLTTNIEAPSFVLKRVGPNNFEYCEKRDGKLTNCHVPAGEEENRYVPFITTIADEILITTGGHADIIIEQANKSKLNIKIAKFAGEIRFNRSGEVTEWNAQSGTFKAPEEFMQQAGLPINKFKKIGFK
jgi:hypothetical protein